MESRNKWHQQRLRGSCNTTSTIGQAAGGFQLGAGEPHGSPDQVPGRVSINIDEQAMRPAGKPWRACTRGEAALVLLLLVYAVSALSFFAVRYQPSGFAEALLLPSFRNINLPYTMFGPTAALALYLSAMLRAAAVSTALSSDQDQLLAEQETKALIAESKDCLALPASKASLFLICVAGLSYLYYNTVILRGRTTSSFVVPFVTWFVGVVPLASIAIRNMSVGVLRRHRGETAAYVRSIVLPLALKVGLVQISALVYGVCLATGRGTWGIGKYDRGVVCNYVDAEYIKTNCTATYPLPVTCVEDGLYPPYTSVYTACAGATATIELSDRILSGTFGSLFLMLMVIFPEYIRQAPS